MRAARRRQGCFMTIRDMLTTKPRAYLSALACSAALGLAPAAYASDYPTKAQVEDAIKTAPRTTIMVVDNDGDGTKISRILLEDIAACELEKAHMISRGVATSDPKLKPAIDAYLKSVEVGMPKNRTYGFDYPVSAPDLNGDKKLCNLWQRPK